MEKVAELKQILKNEPVGKWLGMEYYAISKDQLEFIISYLEKGGISNGN